MQFPDSIFSANIDRALAWTVLHSIWQITLIALLAGIALFTMRAKSAKLRYQVANAALLTILACTIATFIWQLKSREHAWKEVKSAWQEEMQTAPILADSTLVMNAKTPLPSGLKPLRHVRAEKNFMDYFDEHLPMIVLVWLLGLCVFLFRLMGGISYTYYLKQRMNFPVDVYWTEMFDDLRKRAGFEKPIDLLESALVRSPLTIGHLKPIILFPIGIINRLSEQEVEAILAHELAHIIRHDYLFNILQSLVEALFYYHPAVWWLSAQVRNERESACDDMAIALLGNKLNYAKALVTMQEMAFFPLSPALTFAGQGKKQFLTRMQRLFSHTTFKINIMEKWIATLLVACSIVALAIGQRVMPTLNPDTRSSEQSTQGDPKKGLWQAEFFKDSVCINLSGGDRNNHWNHGSCYLRSEFTNLNPTAGETSFSLTRPAGTIVFTGQIEKEEGYGRYQFTPNAAYQQELAAQGIRITEDFLMFHLFFAGFPSDYVSSLKKEGFTKIGEDELTQLAVFNIDLPAVVACKKLSKDLGNSNISIDEIVGLKIHNISPDFVKDAQKMGLGEMSMDDIMTMRIHNISPEFIAESKKMGLGELSFDDITTMKIHGITPEFIAECKKQGFENLSFDDITTMKIHGITPEFIAESKKQGLGDLSFDDITAMKIHGITPEFIAESKKQGFGNLSFDDITTMKIHGITPEFIAESKKQGLGDLSFDDITTMKIHGITPEFIAKSKKQGLGDLSFDDITTMKIHGITPEFIAESKKQGLGDLSFDDITMMKIHGITPEFIQKARDMNLGNLDFDNIVAMKIHNITPEFSKTFSDIGFKNQTIDDLVAARIHNLSPEFIAKAEKKGYKFPSLEEYAELKIREMSRRRTE